MLFQSLSINSTMEARDLCLQAQGMFERWPPQVLWGLTDTPAGEGSKVRVKGMDELVKEMEEEEWEEEGMTKGEDGGPGREGWRE